MTPEESSNFKSESGIRRFCAIVVNCFCRFGNFVRRLMKLDHHNSEIYEICDIETSSIISGATTVSSFTISALESHLRSDLNTGSYAVHTSSNETLDQTKVRSNLNPDPSSGDCKPAEPIQSSVVNSKPHIVVDGKSMAKQSKKTAQTKDVKDLNKVKDKQLDDRNKFTSPKVKERLNETKDLSPDESNKEALNDRFHPTALLESSGRNPQEKLVTVNPKEISPKSSSAKCKTGRKNASAKCKTDHEKPHKDPEDTASSGESSRKLNTTGEIQDMSPSDNIAPVTVDKLQEDVKYLYLEDDKICQNPNSITSSNLDIHTSDLNVVEPKDDILCGQRSKISGKLGRKSSPIIKSCLWSVDDDSANENTGPSKTSKKHKIISPARFLRRLSGKSKLPIPTRAGRNEKLKESSSRDQSKSVRGSISDTDSSIETTKERLPCTSSSMTKSENSIEISRDERKAAKPESNKHYDHVRSADCELKEGGEIVKSVSRKQNLTDTLKSAGDGNNIKENENSFTERYPIISSLPLSKFTLSLKNLTRKFILFDIFSDQPRLHETVTIQDIIFYELCMELCADPHDRKLVTHVDRKLVTHLLRSPFHFTDRQLNVELVELFRDALVQYSQSHPNRVQLETKLRHLRLMRNENFREIITHVVSDEVIAVSSASEDEDETDGSEVDDIITFNDVGTCTNVEEPTIAYITVTAPNKRFIPRDPTRYIKKNEKCIQVDDSIENELGEAKKQEDLYSIAYQQEMFNIGTYRMDDHVNVEKAKKGCRPEEKQKVKTRGIPNKHLESLETVLKQDSSCTGDIGEEATAFGENVDIDRNDEKSQKVDYKAEPVILDMRHMEEVPVQVIQNRRKSSPPSSGKKKRKNKRRLSNESVVKKLDLSFHISGQL